MMLLKSIFFLEILIICKIFFSAAVNLEKQLSKPRSVEKEQAIISAVKKEWFDQYLDHFNPNDLRKWKQLYYTNDEYYQHGGPVFLMVGGEDTPVKGWATNGSWIEYAKRFGAFLFVLDHRFYGESRPTEDTSTENLKYLTVEQALADLATFIAAMKQKHKFDENNKWIAFGGSYPGMLAAWLRLKYPHLIHGVVSSSSIFLPIMDYGDYFRIISQIFKAHSNECEEAIKDGTLEVNTLLQQKQGGPILTKNFKLCDPIDELMTEKDIANLNYRLAFNFGFMQMYGIDLSFLGFGVGTSNITVDMICDIMSDKHQKSAMERLADINSLMMSVNNLTCLDYKYEKMINSIKDPTWNASNESYDDRRFWYLFCTAFATFRTSSFQLGTFGDKFPVEFYIQICMDVFGPEYNATYINKRIQRMNSEYGGLNISITNTVFVHGSIDPWHLAGVLQNVTNGPSVIYIEGTAHVADMAPEAKKDLPQLKAARRQISEYIKLWLDQ